MYQYAASLVSVYDGDTVHVTIDCGFRITLTGKVRLARINAPELAAPGGQEAKTFLLGLLSQRPLVIETKKDPADKWGRWLGDITLADGTNVSDAMVAAGHAAYWDGEGSKPVPKVAS